MATLSISHFRIQLIRIACTKWIEMNPKKSYFHELAEDKLKWKIDTLFDGLTRIAPMQTQLLLF